MIADAVAEGAVDNEHATGDTIGCAELYSAIAEHGTGLQPSDDQPPSRVSGPTDENAAASHRASGATCAQSGQIGGYRHCRIGLLIPESKRAGNDLHAIAFRPRMEAARVRGNDVDPMRFHVAATHIVAREQVYAADNA